MITAVEIRKKTERKYVDYLRSVVAGSEFEPIVIPCDKKASASMDEYQRELTDIRSQSKEVKGFGYTIEWKTVKTKALGEQDLPERVLFESASDIERFLQKCGEVSQFRKDVAMLLDEFPQLRSWVERYPLKVVENASFWSDLLKVCAILWQTLVLGCTFVNCPLRCIPSLLNVTRECFVSCWILSL